MAARARRGGLLRQRDFRRLWLADVFSQLGARISVLGVPLLATNTLGASTFEVSALRTAQTAAYLLVGLQAGAWCDRIRTRPVLISTDLARAGVLASVPVAAAFGVLTVWQLLAVVFVAGLGTVFFDVAHQTYLPRLVNRQEVVEGTAKLQANPSLAAVAAPAATGYLVQWLGGPAAILANALGYLWSATWLRRIRSPERAPNTAAHRLRLRDQIGEGIRLVCGHPILRTLGTSGALFSLCQSMHLALTVVFLVRQLHLSPGSVGLLSTIGLTGAVLGAWVARNVATLLGHARALVIAYLVCGLAYVLYPLTTPGWGLSFWALAGVGTGFCVVVLNVLEVSLRPLICPQQLLGRVNATMRFLNSAGAPVGSLLGGALATAVGLRPALWTAALGLLAAASWVVCSPLRGMRDLPEGTRPDQ